MGPHDLGRSRLVLAGESAVVGDRSASVRSNGLYGPGNDKKVDGAPHHMTANIEAPLDPATQDTTPQVAVNDIGSEEDFLAAIDQTIKYFNDGDIVEGTIVKVDRDEVLLDIGYKTEGVIPSRELSIKH